MGKKNFFKELSEWVFALGIAVVLGVTINNFFVVAKVDGVSMMETLHDGEFLLINKLNYKLNEPKFYDVVAFKFYDKNENLQKNFVKRIIGLPGDRIDISNGELYINSEHIDEEIDTYILLDDVDFPVIVPDKSYFVMGDNRDNSHDSRSSDVSFVKFEEIIGSTSFRIWPINKFGKVEQKKLIGFDE